MNKIKTLVTLVFATVGLAIILSSQASAWGPERQTYTNDVPASYATFNSITDNVAVGDERNFVRVGEAGSSAPYTDEIEIEAGKEYEVYIYYHNNAASNTNAMGYGMATAAKVSSAYPTIVRSGERGMVSGIISWSYVTPDNDTPQTGTVWDEAYLTTKEDGVVLRYKTGTATIHNAGSTDNSVLSTRLFTENGTFIGYNTLNGVLPGCAEYSGYITYTLVAEKTDLSLSKQISLDGETWADEVTAKPGDYVIYKATFNNLGNTDLTNAIFKDAHDAGLTIVPGSIRLFNVNNMDGTTIEDVLDTSGYNTGNAAAGALVEIIYQAKISQDESLCNKTLNNTIFVNYNSTEQRSDSASIVVACDAEEETTDPSVDPTTPQKTCATNPEMEGCRELPNTGPVEIIMAIVIVLGIGGGGYYLYRTKRTLKTVEDSVSGKNTDGTPKSDPSSQNPDDMV